MESRIAGFAAYELDAVSVWVAWLQGNPHDQAIGASLCAKGAAGIAFENDDQRPQTPLIRTGARGARSSPAR